MAGRAPPRGPAWRSAHGGDRGTDRPTQDSAGEFVACLRVLVLVLVQDCGSGLVSIVDGGVVSLRPGEDRGVPEQTARLARAAFRRGNVYLRMRDELRVRFDDREFGELFAVRGRPGLSPARLALVSVLQFMENLTDRQAADMVRGRIDWKYLLGLELDDAGFDASVLSEFRSRLVDADAAERLIFDRVLGILREAGMLGGARRQRSDSTHVLAAVRSLNRLELVGETLRAALEALAGVAGPWLAGWVPTDWYERYGPRIDQWRLPKSETERVTLTQTIAEDGYTLAGALSRPDAPAWAAELSAVQTLRTVWIQQFYRDERGARLREPKEDGLAPAADRIVSAYDTDARYGMKRGHGWEGYKVHLCETCTDDHPHLITAVLTTAATVCDVQVTDQIHQAQAARDLTPDEHLVDAGYIDAELLITARRNHGITLTGPVLPDASWQAHTDGGHTLPTFTIDWDQQQATCPAGATSISWKQHPSQPGKTTVLFSRTDCMPCPDRPKCTRNTSGARSISLAPREQQQALTQARTDQQTTTWQRRYATRAGVEGTISQAVRAYRLRRTRYTGQPKTHLNSLLTATAINIARADAWITGHPLHPTRHSRFAQLQYDLAA
ncbi:IS1182 family transposase [Phytohabitans sp. ZYX-F-186]|uniref:IS1182 family transposase n=2 Tax=Phytohabitans maris TaxID=3071409 RepID=A0ABU0ZQX7_9ACTN|nr:IS1182 family transposase [Phytohabitans sp. ZYX-F-186]MDQ7909432.1 IS1182 family transposase [Phytohabitans sp. ZYX-F-186]